jgi:hypothetical protein
MRLALVFLAACAREPLDLCPEVAAGELAVSELGQGWIELAAGERALELAGLRLEVQRLDGSGARRWLVHDEAVRVDAHGLLVLAAELPPAGVLDLWACDERVDRVSWTALPEPGALARRGEGFCVAPASPGAENPSCP